MDYAKINGRALTDNQIQQYFERLQLTSRYQQDNIFVLPTPNLELLSSLQDAHLRHIPFDNLDILNEKTATLKRPDLFHKIILHNRGGICFELNGLFNWLLESLGYDVTSYAARYIDRFNPYQLRRHRLMCVKLEEQRYIVDVGVNSESPRKPLLLQTELVQDDGTSQYNLPRRIFTVGYCGKRNRISTGSSSWPSQKTPKLIRITSCPCSGAKEVLNPPLSKVKPCPFSVKIVILPCVVIS